MLALLVSSPEVFKVGNVVAADRKDTSWGWMPWVYILPLSGFYLGNIHNDSLHCKLLCGLNINACDTCSLSFANIPSKYRARGN